MSKTPRRPILKAAGMSSAYYSLSLAQGQLCSLFKSQSEPKHQQHVVPLSPRLRNELQKERKIYYNWLADWDRNQNFNRFLILQKFIAECSGFSKAELDTRFGHCSELVFYHIFSFFKVNCKQFCSIALQLRALRIFLEASSGQEFTEHFIKEGGHVTVAEMLDSKHLELNDQIEILLVISSLAVSYKNRTTLVDDKIPTYIIDTFNKIKDNEYHRITVTIFSKIGDGSPQLSEQIMNVILPCFLVYANDQRALKTLARSYRILMLPELSNSFDIKNHLYELIILTKSDIQEVQNDGIMIFSHLAVNEAPLRRTFLIQAVGDLLGFSKDDVTEEESVSLELQQRFVLRLFVDIFSKKSEATECLCQLMSSLLPNLTRLLGDSTNFSNQNFAAQCICKMIQYEPQARVYLSNAIPEDWVVALIKDPKEFCINMTQTQCYTLTSLERSQFLINQPTPVTKSVEVKTPKKCFNQTVKTNESTVVVRDSPLKFAPVIVDVNDIL